MARYLVLTDMHFGTPESAVNRAAPRQALTSYIASQPGWDEIVLAGDLLDGNLSTFKRAIEGDRAGTLFGFRQFLAELHAQAKGGLSAVAKRWIYVPGNHDYKIWDILASRVAFEDVLAKGDRLNEKVPMPLQRHSWTGTLAFVAGIWKGEGYDESAGVTVEYPDHRLAFGDADLVITHGHYLDTSQTRFSDLSEVVPPGLSPAEAAERVRKIFIETAQYQTLANAMSFTRDTTQIVSALFGPASLGNRVKKLYDAIRGWFVGLFYRPEGKRGEGLSARWLRNVDAYLEHFAPPEPTARPVRWFVFGHTHEQGAQESPKGVAVANAGSCYEAHGKAITFVRIDAPEGGPPQVQLAGVARVGQGWAVV